MILRHFGFALKRFRAERGLSQEQFALQIGMDRTYYASVESGKRNIALRNIEKIARGFDVSLEELFRQVTTSQHQSPHAN
jgi:transcriptional regulator with XRE-family HTH domain